MLTKGLFTQNKENVYHHSQTFKHKIPKELLQCNPRQKAVVLLVEYLKPVYSYFYCPRC